MTAYWSVVSGFSRSFTVPFIDVLFKAQGPIVSALWGMMLEASQDAFFANVSLHGRVHRS